MCTTNPSTLDLQLNVPSQGQSNDGKVSCSRTQVSWLGIKNIQVKLHRAASATKAAQHKKICLRDLCYQPNKLTPVSFAIICQAIFSASAGLRSWLKGLSSVLFTRTHHKRYAGFYLLPQNWHTKNLSTFKGSAENTTCGFLLGKGHPMRKLKIST